MMILAVIVGLGSGAAAVNATLAALGGGALAAGGGGMALGSAVLGAATLGVGILVYPSLSEYLAERNSSSATASYDDTVQQLEQEQKTLTTLDL